MGLIEKDYIMRLIYEILRTLLRLIFGIDIAKKSGWMFEAEQKQQEYRQLTELIEKGDINEAENLLYRQLDVHDKRDLELALRFYAYLNEKDTDFLEEHDYSRKEIADGIRMACSLYGYGTMAESLLAEMDTEM